MREEVKSTPISLVLHFVMRYALLMFFSMLLSACGSTPSVKLAAPASGNSSFVFRDDRPSEQKLSRIDSDSFGTTLIYGDDNLSPPVTEILRAILQEQFRTQLEGKTVSLTKFHVRVSGQEASVDYGRLHNTMSASVQNGAIVEPLAGLVILGIEKLKNAKVVSIDIEGSVDNTPFQSYVSDRYLWKLTEENMRASLTHSLENIVADIRQIIEDKSKVSIEEVATLEMFGDYKSELDMLGSSDCGESAPKVSAETYFRHGKELVASNKYKAAMACFLRAQEERDANTYRESCLQISMMYELGWGVDKDIEAAKIWLKKSEQ